MLLAVGGDAPYCNEKSASLTLCMRVGFVLFRPLAIRGVVSPGHSRCDTPGCQKARSALRCIKTLEARGRPPRAGNSQKARSALRFIKTPDETVTPETFDLASESTERLKVH